VVVSSYGARSYGARSYGARLDKGMVGCRPFYIMVKIRLLSSSVFSRF
jgi:hypothetical protein